LLVIVQQILAIRVESDGVVDGGSDSLILLDIIDECKVLEGFGMWGCKNAGGVLYEVLLKLFSFYEEFPRSGAVGELVLIDHLLIILIP
jgi:hypothetical protein